jgi:hypothetical protein
VKFVVPPTFTEKKIGKRRREEGVVEGKSERVRLLEDRLRMLRRYQRLRIIRKRSELSIGQREQVRYLLADLRRRIEENVIAERRLR